MQARSCIAVLFVVFSTNLTGIAGCSSDTPDGNSPPRDVILITIDTLRQDHMSIYGYERETTPNLRRFFAGTAIFERSYSTASNTPASVVSILTGLWPQQHGVRLFYQLIDDSVTTMPEFLRSTHETAGFVSGNVLTDEAIGLADRFDYFDDYLAELENKRRMYERTARKTTDAVLSWLGSRNDRTRPLFLWVHYMDPHGPYAPPPEWKRTFTHAQPAMIGIHMIPKYMLKSDVQIGDRYDGLDFLDAYDEEIAYMDSEVGRLLDGIDRLNGIDDALIIFTADHGESLMDHEKWFVHNYHVYEELIRVPLLVRGTGITDRFRTVLASGVDVVPTILSWLNETPPVSMPGRNLFAQGADTRDRVVFAESNTVKHQWRAAIKGNEKLVREVGSLYGKVWIGESRRYDLAVDPGETSSTAWPTRGSPLVDQFVALIDADPDPAGRPEQYAKGAQLTGPKIAPRATQEDLKALRALGYIE